jgi:hypothetical protein
MRNAEEALALYAEAEAKEGCTSLSAHLVRSERRSAVASDLRDHMIAGCSKRSGRTCRE